MGGGIRKLRERNRVWHMSRWKCCRGARYTCSAVGCSETMCSIHRCGPDHVQHAPVRSRPCAACTGAVQTMCSMQQFGRDHVQHAPVRSRPSAACSSSGETKCSVQRCRRDQVQ
eukprot:53183-Chlamydomonas_euryale.AAC.1